MKALQRGLVALVGAGTLIAGAATATPALAVPSSPSGVRTVNVCNQKVSAGHYSCFAMRRSDLGFKSKNHYQPDSNNPAATPSGYGPSSLQSAYNLPSSTDGSGQRVYIVDAYDDPNAESDLATYRSQYGLPSCTTANGCFQKLNQNGATSPLPSGNTGWAGEISLDLDMVSAICPKCGITLIEANDASNNLFTAVKTAANLGAKYVSMSWGGPESSSNASYDSSYFNSSGVVYSASTGDGAYQDGVEYPASSAKTVAVGGTSLKTASNSRGWTESVWYTNSTEGADSGCSAYTAKPSFQSSAVSNSICSKRAIADVSADADPATGVAVYQTYGGSGWAVYGGTSAAAPMIASVYALAANPASTPASQPYANTGSLYDVTSGSNGSCSPSTLCTAGPGWDGPTGLGTPNGIGAFGGSGGGGNTVTVTNPGSQTGTVGTAVSLQIAASDSGGAALTYSATGLPAGLSIGSTTGKITGTPTTAGTYSTKVTATDSTGASGSATFTWTISSSGGTSCSGNIMKNPGFESGSANWTASSGVIQTNGTYAHSGNGYAWLDGYGTTHTDTLSQTVTIPAGCSVTLSYYLWVSSSERTTTQAYDTLKVTANGTNVQSFSNLNKGSGYVLRSVSLSSYAGKSVTIKWTGTEDSSLATSFFIDDTAVTLS